MPNGTYAFTVGAVGTYTAAPANGSVVVAGAAVTQSVVFTPTPTGGPGFPSWAIYAVVALAVLLAAALAIVVLRTRRRRKTPPTRPPEGGGPQAP